MSTPETAETSDYLDLSGQSPVIIPGQEWRPGVISELAEVTERIMRLRRFVASEDGFKISGRAADLLLQQCKIMNKYADILISRLAA
jgi:hypothetical protein